MSVIHVTLESNLSDIQRNGLLPRIGPNAEACGETVPAVFCFPDQESCDDAMMNWLGDLFDENAPIAYLHLDISGLRTHPDAAGYEIQVIEHIPASRILYVTVEH